MFTKEYPEIGCLDILNNPNAGKSEHKHYWHIRGKMRHSDIVSSFLFTDQDIHRALIRTNNNIDLIQDQIEKREKLTPSAFLLAYSIFMTIAFMIVLIFK